MALTQPTNRDITDEVAVDAPAGATFLGVTPDKRVAVFNLPDVEAASGSLRFNQVQELTAEQKQLVLQNIGRNEVVRFLVPGGMAPGQALFADASGTGFVARTLTGGGTTPVDPVPTGDYAVAIAAANASASNMRTKTAQLQS